MTKNFLSCCLFLFSILPSNLLFSQDEVPTQMSDAPLHGLAAKFLFLDYSTPNSVDGFQTSNGLELAYLRQIKDKLAVGVPVKIAVVDLPGDIDKTTSVSLDAIAQYRFTGSESTIIPYGFTGMGLVFDKYQNHAVIPIGLGLYYKVGDNSYVTGQLEYRKAFEDDRDNLQFGLGWYFSLQAQPLPPGPLDADKDGIPDETDRCPDEPGDALAFGCPDTDKDGVPNGEDDCPTVKGSAANKGCPSPGDRDADGIADVDDQCPDVPGTLALKGCPSTQPTTIDSDGDGVTDDKDLCPTVLGEIILLGCPDSDGDGIADKDDRCPTEAGLATRNGCPQKDTDKDGIWDEDDECPEVAGKAATKGCPDQDGDGIGDASDECPTTFGKSSAKGCPDIDNDGVPDKTDKCPNQAGDPNHMGCPFIDSDGDGIDDTTDECPNSKGSAALNGCPDRDSDGIPDRLDRCPDEAGEADRNGCPFRDRDNDGVEDSADYCPDEAGSRDARGCPDSDGDGFGDNSDKCPNEAGTNQGCPDLTKEEKEFLQFAARNIYFDTGKATLQAESYKTLNGVADILLKYPRYNLKIEGHTDNVGNNENNRILSDERAKSCYEFMVSRSLGKDRMTYKGFGETKPISDNSTESGRHENRRVEFIVYLQ